MLTKPQLCNMNPIISYKDNDIIVIDNFYTVEEAKRCRDYIDNIAILNRRKKYYGNIIDKKLADIIFACINTKIYIENWYPSQVNNTIRCTKGEIGYYIGEHLDEPILFNVNEKSFYSVLLYLDDGKTGEIVFPEIKKSFFPRAGRLVVFNNSLLHYSTPAQYEKYFLHTELMFKRTEPIIETIDMIEAFTLYNNSRNENDLVKRDIMEKEAFEKCKHIEDMLFA